MSASEANSVVVQRVLPAPPHVAFDEWVDALALGEWMCPRPARATHIELEPVVGGKLRIDIEENGVEFQVTGRYLEIDRPSRLSFSWTCSNWDDPSLETVVTVTFEPQEGDSSLMTIVHTMLPPELAAQHQHGWALIADQLSDALRTPTT